MRALLFALAMIGAPATANGNPLGQYRVSAGPDIAGSLDITADHRFRYVLVAGALDERAEGRWVDRGGKACLFTEPRPTPPTFALATSPPPEPQESDLLVTWPDGRGIAGVDVVLGFASGEPVTGYTQTYGWSMPVDDRRKPVWVELAVPMHGLRSPRFALDGRLKAHVVLTPNDLGVVDFQGECLEARGGILVLRRNDSELRFKRVSRRR